MDKDIVINKTKEFVKRRLEKDFSGHDWFHIERVYNTSKYLGEIEGADIFVVSLGALLHDINDWKVKKEGESDVDIRLLLQEYGVDNEIIDRVLNIINTMSYRGGVTNSSQTTIEGMVIQDADRLDAIGAIGIARTFAYGGSRGREIYNPNISAENFKSVEEYKKNNGTTINHFYEKLLKLKDLMNTDTAKAVAAKKHKIMEEFLEDFYKEWNFK
ncbi:HD domain-containing protein [Clostridium hydrogeniformans]|uniref:HD domain-containing protein n=1 Tax=Clostridium hydrogeniformans TaxID=349933 RepID=UPI000481A1D9|nr:HD domain-containing protein [Clostridium hydrogeniformans]